MGFEAVGSSAVPDGLFFRSEESFFPWAFGSAELVSVGATGSAAGGFEAGFGSEAFRGGGLPASVGTSVGDAGGGAGDPTADVTSFSFGRDFVPKMYNQNDAIVYDFFRSVTTEIISVPWIPDIISNQNGTLVVLSKTTVEYNIHQRWDSKVSTERANSVKNHF